MVKFKVRVEVWLKDELVDAEGKTVEEALKDLGYDVSGVRVGKVYIFNVESESSSDVERVVVDICERLLANPVKDKYFVSVLGHEV
ncbi:MAG: phosphoribosylformylglycinamidine synthase subunit PurS [archaeon GBS-70-058]|nr:phosphoribosylformylglycinamidine synthase subunit PurS [Candidatus Culexarchaeum nevadense]